MGPSTLKTWLKTVFGIATVVGATGLLPAAGFASGLGSTEVAIYGHDQPVVRCELFYICAIRLQPGERLTDEPTIGDSARWSVQSRAGVIGGEPTVYVIAKPSAGAVKTGLFLVTDRRVYSLDMEPSKRGYTQLLTFTYPTPAASAPASEPGSDPKSNTSTNLSK